MHIASPEAADGQPAGCAQVTVLDEHRSRRFRHDVPGYRPVGLAGTAVRRWLPGVDFRDLEGQAAITGGLTTADQDVSGESSAGVEGRLGRRLHVCRPRGPVGPQGDRNFVVGALGRAECGREVRLGRGGHDGLGGLPGVTEDEGGRRDGQDQQEAQGDHAELGLGPRGLLGRVRHVG